MTTDTPTAADLHRAAGIEKMAESGLAACSKFYSLSCPPRSDAPIDCHRYIMSAALVAWEAHCKEEQTND